MAKSDKITSINFSIKKKPNKKHFICITIFNIMLIVKKEEEGCFVETNRL